MLSLKEFLNLLENNLEDLTEEEKKEKHPLNKPMKGDRKKYKVYVKDPKTGNVKKVEFGDPNMSIKRDNPERRKAFRSRHGCDDPSVPKPKTKAKYWACKFWQKSKTVSSLLGKK